MTTRTCTIDGCHNRHVAHGWCHRHYGMWRRTGSPTTPPKTNRTPNTELVEELVWLLDAGESAWQVARQLHITPKAIVHRMRRRIPGVPDATRKRILSAYYPLVEDAA